MPRDTLPLSAEELAIFDRNIPLAKTVAVRCMGQPWAKSVGDLDDLFHTTLVALAGAVRGFDPARGWAFSTYAWTAIYRGVRNSAHRTGLLRWRESQGRREPPVVIALGELERTVTAPPDDDNTATATAAARVHAGLAALEPRDRLVLTLRWLDGLTLVQAGHALELSSQRVCQLEQRALDRLAAVLADDAALQLNAGRRIRRKHRRARIDADDARTTARPAEPAMAA
jgi:RNA polymerase sigma factor (sigma-70 family)